MNRKPLLPMKTIIFSMVCLLFAGCGCSPKPDIITVVGISSNTDSTFSKSSSAIFASDFLIDTRIDESGKALCLTYNKEMAMPIVKNAIITNTLRVFCNQDIGNIKAGQNIEVIPNRNSDQLDHNDKVSLRIPSSDLEQGKRYIFSAIARTVDSMQFENHFAVNVIP